MIYSHSHDALQYSALQKVHGATGLRLHAMCDEEPLAAALRVEAAEFRPVQARSASGRMRRRKRHCSLLMPGRARRGRSRRAVYGLAASTAWAG